MSQYNVTPFPTNGPLTSAELNLRLAELDSALKKNNYAATSAPAVGDDSADGYAVGSRWFDITNRRVYVALVVTPGSAVWKEITVPAAITATSINAVTIIASANVFINDTANAFQTIGLTINQGNNSDTIFSLRSTAFSHGMTALAHQNTFLGVEKVSGGAGGGMFIGYSSGASALRFRGRATTEDATRNTGALAYVSFSAQLRSGTNVVTPGADKNLAVFMTGSLARFIFTTNGDSWEDGTGWTAYDEHDDAKLLDTINTLMLPEPSSMTKEFWSWAQAHRAFLQKNNLISFNADGHHFVNRSRMQELLVGAIRQLNARLERLEHGQP